MDSVPNHDFMELHTIHQHQPHCKRQCFVFSDIAAVAAGIADLPSSQCDIKQQYINCNTTTSAATTNCNINNSNNIDCKLLNRNNDNNYKNYKNTNNKNDNNISTTIHQHDDNTNGGKIIFIFGTILVCIALAGGIPLALQLRSSSLLEARLNFIRRLLTESPLIGYWNNNNNNNNYNHININNYGKIIDKNFSNSIIELKTNYIGAVLWPINVPCKAQYLDAVQLALEDIDKSYRLIGKTKELHIVETTDQLHRIHINKQIAVILGLGGGHTIGASLAVLRSMYSLGTRFVTVTSVDCTTPWAQSAKIKTDHKNNDLITDNNLTNNALSNFGQAVVHEMNRLGMLLDISGLSEAAMMIAIKTTKAPVLITNAVPLSLCNSSVLATIPDRILSLLPDNGGVFMINTEKCNDRKLTIKEAIQIINYVRRITGINHIGLSGVPNSYPFLLAELARDRIWGNSAIKKLVGGNIIRVFKEVEVIKNRLPINEEWIPYEQIQNNLRCKYPET